MKVHFIQQNAWVLPGEYLAWAERHGYETSTTRCWLYEPVPETVDADLLVVLGGWQSPAVTKAECGYYDAEAERELIRRYAGAGRMVVGSCLGAQLIGDALGGGFGHSPEREIGPIEVRLTEAGRADPFLAAFPDRFLTAEWHNDMPGLTEDCAVLAESDGCPYQIVRYGKYVYAFQTHMEFTRDIVAAGLEVDGESLKKGGHFVKSAEEYLAFDFAAMNALLSGFLDAMAGDYSDRMTGVL